MRRLLALAPIVLLTACPAGSGASDGGSADGDGGEGTECTAETADADCNDNDACTTQGCENGFCTWGRPEPALARIGSLDGPALGVDLAGARAHVAAGAAGVRSFDLRPLPDEAAAVLYEHATAAPALGVLENSGQLIAIEGSGGLEVFQAAEAPAAVATYQGADELRGLGRVDDLAVVYAYAAGLEIVGAADWIRRARVNTPGRAQDAVLWGARILVADGLVGVTTVDFSDRMAPKVVEERRIPTEGRVVALARRGNLLVMAEGGAGVGIVDLGAEGGPARIAHVHFPGEVLDVNLLSARTAILAAGQELVLLDLMDPTAPVVWQRATLEGSALDLDEANERILVAMGEAGAAVFNLACTPPPEP